MKILIEDLLAIAEDFISKSANVDQEKESRAGIFQEFPAPLRNLIAKNGGRFGPLVGAFHEFVVDGLEIDNRIVFCRESEGGHFWSCEKGCENPAVWLHWEFDPIAPMKEDASLIEFLIQLMIFEFIAGAPYKRGRLKMSLSELNGILGESQPLELSAWRYPAYPARFFKNNESYMFVYPVPNCFYYFSWGATDLKLVELIDNRCAWDWVE